MAPSQEPTDRLLWAARVADYLTGARFPATRAQLVERAIRGNVPRDVLSALLALPREEYATFAEMVAELRPGERYREQVDRRPIEE